MALSRRKKIIIGVVVIFVVAIVVVISVIATRREEPEVITIKVSARPELKQTVTASGEVRPIRYIKLTSEVPGRIEEIYVTAGDLVTKGKPLVRIDPTELQSSQEAQWAATQASLNDVQNARNAVNSAQQGLIVAESSVAAARQQAVALQTNVDKAQVALNTAQRELKRYTELIEAGVSSRLEYDRARDEYDTAKISLATAKANLEAQNIAVKEANERANQQRIAVKDAQTSIRSSEMRASQQSAMLRGQTIRRDKATQLSPLNGVVADIPTRVGEFAVAGLSTTPLMTIADMSEINVEVNVDETEINNVKVGQAAKVKVDALGDKEIKAEV
ncbi:MAG TPA: efflux RND transporter periplasmic adaptor subunit, partial [Pyrinomonadaceae bacterium]|nr:efflux RND transporter periplasmic adaptor subunit [Pyrinomonadaceae bacterium]